MEMGGSVHVLKGKQTPQSFAESMSKSVLKSLRQLSPADLQTDTGVMHDLSAVTHGAIQGWSCTFPAPVSLR